MGWILRKPNKIAAPPQFRGKPQEQRAFQANFDDMGTAAEQRGKATRAELVQAFLTAADQITVQAVESKGHEPTCSSDLRSTEFVGTI